VTPLGARGMIQLAAKYTVARMMERNDFHERYKRRHAHQRARVSLSP
jgi:tyrosyl-tRNA synthetase